MGKAIILSGGGGTAGSDDTTAKAADVLAGASYLGADTDDEAGTGTMPNNGAVSESLDAGKSYTVPEGYHNGSGKVTANSLSSQTSANASSGDILSGKTAWVNGSQLTGSMPNRGAVSQALAAGGSYTIPAGYHNGSGGGGSKFSCFTDIRYRVRGECGIAIYRLLEWLKDIREHCEPRTGTVWKRLLCELRKFVYTISSNRGVLLRRCVMGS